jgi:hypothetical protein
MPAEVTRLVTLVDLRVADARRLSLLALHEAELSDGRRVVLLDDRGWTWSAVMTVLPDGTQEESDGISAATSVAEIAKTARMVVGPDEPSSGHSKEDADSAHWAHLAAVLRQHGVVVDPSKLKGLRHDVILTERLRSLVSG